MKYEIFTNIKIDEDNYYLLIKQALDKSPIKANKENEIKRLNEELEIIHKRSISNIIYNCYQVANILKEEKEPFELVSPLSNLYVLYLLGVSKINPIESGCRYELCLLDNNIDINIDLMVSQSFLEPLKKTLKNKKIDSNLYGSKELEIFKKLDNDKNKDKANKYIKVPYITFYNQYKDLGFKPINNIEENPILNINMMYSLIRDVFKDNNIDNLNKLYDVDSLYTYLVEDLKIDKIDAIKLAKEIKTGSFNSNGYKNYKFKEEDIKLFKNIKYLISRGPSMERIYYKIKLEEYKLKDPIKYKNIENNIHKKVNKLALALKVYDYIRSPNYSYKIKFKDIYKQFNLEGRMSLQAFIRLLKNVLWTDLYGTMNIPYLEEMKIIYMLNMVVKFPNTYVSSTEIIAALRKSGKMSSRQIRRYISAIKEIGIKIITRKGMPSPGYRLEEKFNVSMLGEI